MVSREFLPSQLRGVRALLDCLCERRFLVSGSVSGCHTGVQGMHVCLSDSLERCVGPVHLWVMCFFSVLWP